MTDTQQTSFDRSVIFFFRIAMGWTFFYAAVHHFGDTKFVEGFLSHTKTFHDVYAPLTAPAIAPTLTFLVEYGHMLIGLSLLTGVGFTLSLYIGELAFPLVGPQQGQVRAGVIVGSLLSTLAGMGVLAWAQMRRDREA